MSPVTLKPEQLLDAILDSPCTSVAILDAELKFVRVSRTYAEADNKTPEYFVGKKHFDLYPHAENQAIFENALKTGLAINFNARPFQYTRQPERGTTYWDWHLAPITDKDGDTSGLILSLQDVSARIHAIEDLELKSRELSRLNRELEHRVHERTEELRQDKNLLDSILNATNALVILLDPQGHIQLFNHHCEIRTQYRASEVKNRLLWDVLHPYPDIKDVAAQYLKPLAGGTQSHRTVWHNRSGNRRKIEYTLQPMLNRQGTLEYILLTGIDITEAELTQSRLARAQKLESIGHLAGGIAHNFNNLLASILGYTRLTQNKLAVNKLEKLPIFLKEIEAAGNRASELVNQMLTYSRGGKHMLSLFSPHENLLNTVDLMRSAIPSSIEIKTELEPVPDLVQADPELIQQAVTNIMLNSSEAIEGTGSIQIKLTTKDVSSLTCASCHEDFSGRFAAISISDNGRGIDEEVLRNIFDPYFTTKPAGEGSGMGLSIVHGIIHACDGHIVVESTLGVATGISLYLPVFAMEGRHTSSSPFTEQTHPNPGLNILVVDDEPQIVGYLSERLKMEGHSVSSALSGNDALATISARSGEFDLMITDQTMPDMLGVELAQRARKIQPDLPVILCSGYSNMREMDLGSTAISQFISKPIDEPILFEAIGRFARKRRRLV